jgi:hypothetical protein
MAQALKIRTVVSGKTLTLSDLDAFIGKRVEVIVMEDDSVDRAPASPQPAKRRFGTLAGKLSTPDDFDAPLPPEVQRYFDGEYDT